jgi:hypothetical protein
MLCKIWGFHGSDYEECLLRYKTPVRTSQETHLFSATESRQLMLCKIWGCHGGVYEEWGFLGYTTQLVLDRRHITAPLQIQTSYCYINVCRFDGSDYKECRILGYKNPFLTLKKTYYFSASESSRLMLCRIWIFHGDDYGECLLLGFYTVSLL